MSNKNLIDDPEFNTELMDSDSEASQQIDNQLKVVDSEFGDSLPYDLTRIENEIGFLSQTATATMFEMGKRFLLIKEHEVHGEYLSSLERMGYKPRSVQKLMQATLKFSNAPSTALLGKTKLFELMTEDDENLEALEEGGTVAGLTLDKIDKMSAGELRKSLREAKDKAKEDAEIAEEQLLEKSEQINELDAQLKRREKASPDEIHAELIDDIDTTFKRITGLITKIDARANELIQSPDLEEDLTHHVASQIHRLRHRLETVLSRNALMLIEVSALGDDDIDPKTGNPVWMLEEE